MRLSHQASSLSSLSSRQAPCVTAFNCVLLMTSCRLNIATVPTAARRLSSVRMENSEITSTAIAAMGPDEPSSPTGEGSPAEAYSKYDDPNYYDPKWGQNPPKVWESCLQEFTIFPKLPIEIRQTIWKLTVRPRTVEIYRSTTRGYWSNVKVPTALRVNRDSRNAVSYLYPLCFGSVFHEPRIVFNFSMDILYFDDMIWT